MRNVLANGWNRLPTQIRKGIVLFVGMFFVIAAGLTGWLPGPGGIPLFLIGVAILATEFEWAKRLRDFTLHHVHSAGRWLRAHPVIMKLSIITVIVVACVSTYSLYKLVTS